MVETFDQNQYQLQAELLRHGGMNWVTRGVYFGEQRNYVEMDIDDTFSPDDAWSVAKHENGSQLRRRAAQDQPTSNTPRNGLKKTTSAWTSCSMAAIVSSTSEENPKGQMGRSAAGGVPEDGPRDRQAYADSFGWINHT